MLSRTLWRRVTFTLALLFTGAIFAACYHAIQKNRPSLLPLGFVLWGFDSSLPLVLAIWIVGRMRAWRSWSNWGRMTMYVLAFAYGGMLFYATQDWWIGKNFQQPGLEYTDYGSPVVFSVPLLIYVLLLFPIFRAFRLVLDASDQPISIRSMSIIDLMLWQTLAAVTCAWVRILNSPLAPLTIYSSSTMSQNFRKEGFDLLLSVIPATILIVQLFAWRRHWLLAVFVLVLGWVVDAFATGLATHAITSFTDTSFGVLSGNSFDRWCYIGGRSLLGFTFSGLALLFGISIRKAQPERRATAESQTKPKPQNRNASDD
jgi:hypothetical protein